ncbi:MAG: DUF4391 domain-containing protein [Clostridiales bacterium]|nr:DUF4391 domain-containing protein [Clostridiales bacterium]
MFDLSSKTQVNKHFKLPELYKLIGASKEVKADTGNVMSVTLTNVLNADTMNFAASDMVKEIYVFEIVLNDRTIPSLFLSTLDKAINLHTVFLLRHENQILLYGAYKEYGEKNMKIGKYYYTEWTADSLIKLPINVSNLEDIYTAIIDELIPIAARKSESTKDFVVRYDEIQRLQKEIAKLQHAVDIEKQSKRRFNLNAELKEIKHKLEELA